MSTHENASGPSRRRLSPPSARIVASLATVALLGAAPSAAHAAAWLGGPQFQSGPQAVAGDFAEAPDGSSTAAWIETSGTAATVRFQHAGPDDALSPPRTLGPAAPAVQGFPQVATAPSSMTAVAYLSTASSPAAAPTLRVALIDAGGGLLRDTLVTTFTSADAQDGIFGDVAVDSAGDATVAWTSGNSAGGGGHAHAARVSAADGVVTSYPTLGSSTVALLGATGDTVGAAMTPDGTAWAGWVGSDHVASVARLNNDGTLDSSAVPSGAPTPGIDITASAAGGAIAWQALPLDPDDVSIADSSVAGVRLPTSGALTGTSFQTSSLPTTSGFSPLGSGFGIVAAPDGTITVQSSGLLLADALPRGKTEISRFAPEAMTANAQQIGGDAMLAYGLGIGGAPDGSVIAASLQGDGGPTSALAGSRIAPDGALSPSTAVSSLDTPEPQAVAATFSTQADNLNGGMIGYLTGGVSGAGGPWSVQTFRLDGAGPTVTADVPATGAPLAPITFSGTVADPSTATLSWDFGDGSGDTGLRVDHAYATPGTYTVTASATDEHDNTTAMTRAIVVAAPTSDDGGGRGTPPTKSDDGGGRDTPPPAAARAAASLKITKATRSGAKVTVAGTIAKSASGKVAIVYAQRVGRKTVKVRKAVSIAKGKWSTTLTLPRSLTRGRAARGNGTVTVSFAGTDAVKRASAKHAVSFARARSGKRAKRGSSSKRSPSA
ncbi:MAG TPA: PKD domain-containing protein [Conexibacter sp.]|jgi:hypothetical protein